MALATVGQVDFAAAQQQLPAATQQTATIKRTPLQKFDVPGTNYETAIGMAEIVPNVNIGRHTHPGPKSGYMVEGEMVLFVEGQPEKTVKAGQSYQCPPGAIHDRRPAPMGPKLLQRMWSKKASRLPLLRPSRRMSALGHKRTFAVQNAMSALPPKADISSAQSHVRFVPKADIRSFDDYIHAPQKCV